MVREITHHFARLQAYLFDIVYIDYRASYSVHVIFPNPLTHKHTHTQRAFTSGIQAIIFCRDSSDLLILPDRGEVYMASVL